MMRDGDGDGVIERLLRSASSSDGARDESAAVSTGDVDAPDRVVGAGDELDLDLRDEDAGTAGGSIELDTFVDAVPD